MVVTIYLLWVRGANLQCAHFTRDVLASVAKTRGEGEEEGEEEGDEQCLNGYYISLFPDYLQ